MPGISSIGQDAMRGEPPSDSKSGEGTEPKNEKIYVNPISVEGQKFLSELKRGLRSDDKFKLNDLNPISKENSWVTQLLDYVNYVDKNKIRAHTIKFLFADAHKPSTTPIAAYDAKIISENLTINDPNTTIIILKETSHGFVGGQQRDTVSYNIYASNKQQAKDILGIKDTEF